MAADTTESDKPVRGREGTEHLARDGAGPVRLVTRDLERRLELVINGDGSLTAETGVSGRKLRGEEPGWGGGVCRAGQRKVNNVDRLRGHTIKAHLGLKLSGPRLNSR